MEDLMQKITNLAKRRGFVFPSSEIYGGVEALWDYGPLGSILKNNLKRAWIKRFIQQRDDVALIDAAILMHPQVWKASGHVEHFTDPLIECKTCHSRFRADHMIDGRFVGQGEAKEPNQCPTCGDKDFTPARQFNLMFKTFLGPVENETNVTYLRPETAQAMFTNFQLVQESQRLQVPFGIAQVGRSFRNEITTGNFIFRSREFEIAEIEYFVQLGQDDAVFETWLNEWKQFCVAAGLSEKNLRLFEHPKGSLAHYSKRTVDIEYRFPFGWGEIAGVANRTDFDLKQHAEASGKKLDILDEKTGKKYIPLVIEPTLGIDRLLLAIFCEAYEEVGGGRTTTTKAAKEKEIVLHLPPLLAPVQVAVLPLVRNKQELTVRAREVFKLLKQHFMCQYDETGSIGRRYRRQDEIGTPFCVTVDFESVQKNDVTLRDRDTMKQDRVSLLDLVSAIKERIHV